MKDKILEMLYNIKANCINCCNHNNCLGCTFNDDEHCTLLELTNHLYDNPRDWDMRKIEELL